MIEIEPFTEALTGTAYQQISAFLATFDRHDPESRLLVARIAERVHGEMYRRERAAYPEYVDLGGES